MKKLNIIYIVLLVALLGSCVKNANLKISKTPKLVVYCLLNPDDSVTRIFVDYSSPSGSISNSDFYNWGYEHAEIEISNGSKTHTLSYDLLNKTYMFNHKDFNIEPGVRYTLKVRDLANGTQVQAETQVPVDRAQNLGIEIDSVLSANEELETTYFTKISWDDILGQRNFYAYDFVDSSSFRSPSLMSMFMEGKSYVQTDDKVANGRIEAEPQELTGHFGGRDVMAVLYAAIARGDASIRVYNLDKPLYDYLVYAGVSNGDDNIFQDPVTVYTNIEGGLGVFGAYRETKHIIDKLK